MEILLEQNEIYVEHIASRLIYKVKSLEMYHGKMELLVNLGLEYGWGFINPDISTAQGWVKADCFGADFQCKQEIFYIMSENLRECLEGKGYVILEGAIKEILKGEENE